MRWIPVIFILLLAGCGGRNKVPDDILPPVKMQAVMWDMIRADQFLGSYAFIKDTSLNKKNESIKLYARVMDLHKISQEKFQKSFAYYEARPALMRMIMDSLSQPPKAIAAKPVEITEPVTTDTAKTILAPGTIKKDSTPRFRPKIKKVLKPD